jgi:hypothetical protein
VLYNPKWDKTANDTSVSFKGFQAWVEAQNPKGRYHYATKRHCAVGRWLQATDHHMLLRGHWAADNLLYHIDRLAGQSPCTYGALANRLREYERIAEVPF